MHLTGLIKHCVVSGLAFSGEYTMFENNKITTLPNHHILKPALKLVVLTPSSTFLPINVFFYN